MQNSIQLMTRAQAADAIGMSVSWLDKQRAANGGPAYVRIGRAVRYSRDGLEKFIKQNEAGGVAGDNCAVRGA